MAVALPGQFYALTRVGGKMGMKKARWASTVLLVRSLFLWFKSDLVSPIAGTLQICRVPLSLDFLFDNVLGDSLWKRITLEEIPMLASVANRRFICRDKVKTICRVF